MQCLHTYTHVDICAHIYSICVFLYIRYTHDNRVLHTYALCRRWGLFYSHHHHHPISSTIACRHLHHPATTTTKTTESQKQIQSSLHTKGGGGQTVPASLPPLIIRFSSVGRPVSCTSLTLPHFRTLFLWFLHAFPTPSDSATFFPSRSDSCTLLCFPLIPARLSVSPLIPGPFSVFLWFVHACLAF